MINISQIDSPSDSTSGMFIIYAWSAKHRKAVRYSFWLEENHAHFMSHFVSEHLWPV